MSDTMYRCTFPDLYSKGSKVSDRQGHYVEAPSAKDAAVKAAKRAKREGMRVDVQPWGSSDPLDSKPTRYST